MCAILKYLDHYVFGIMHKKVPKIVKVLPRLLLLDIIFLLEEGKICALKAITIDNITIFLHNLDGHS